jgi:transcriptional regulator with XRE-family HTH domain
MMNAETGNTQPQLQGHRLRKLRKDKGLSAEKLARLSDVSTRQIWRLEGDTRPNSAAITVARVAQALETSLEYLLGMTDDPQLLSPSDR